MGCQLLSSWLWPGSWYNMLNFEQVLSETLCNLWSTSTAFLDAHAWLAMRVQWGIASNHCFRSFWYHFPDFPVNTVAALLEKRWENERVPALGAICAIQGKHPVRRRCLIYFKYTVIWLCLIYSCDTSTTPECIMQDFADLIWKLICRLS